MFQLVLVMVLPDLTFALQSADFDIGIRSVDLHVWCREGIRAANMHAYGRSTLVHDNARRLKIGIIHGMELIRETVKSLPFQPDRRIP